MDNQEQNQQNLNQPVAEQPPVEQSVQPPQQPQVAEEKPKSKWRKVVKIIIIILAIIIIPAGFLMLAPFWVPTVMGPFSSDLEHFNDSDLQLKKVIVPREENAYYDFFVFNEESVEIESIINVHYNSDEYERYADHFNGQEWDKEFAENVLTQNIEVYSIFAEAMKKPKYQDPSVEDPEKISSATLIPPMNGFRKLARVEGIAALYLFKEINEKEGIEEAFKIIDFGQKIQNSQPQLIGYLISQTIKKIGLDVLRVMIAETSLSSDELISYKEQLERFKNNEDGLERALKAEHAVLMEMMDDPLVRTSRALSDAGIAGEEVDIVDSIGISPRKLFYYQPNKTKELHAGDARWRISNVHKNCSLIQPLVVEKVEFSEDFIGMIFDAVKLSFTENAIGQVLYSIIGGVGFETVFDKKCNEDLSISVNQLLLAIKAYQMENGSLPNSLEELVPKYILEVPRDPFDGNPIRFSPQKKILYSVGKDGVDSGGSEGNDWSRMDDPTFRLPELTETNQVDLSIEQQAQGVLDLIKKGENYYNELVSSGELNPKQKTADWLKLNPLVKDATVTPTGISILFKIGIEAQILTESFGSLGI